MHRSRSSTAQGLLGGALLVAACSLTVPDENEFFGSARGGNAGSGGAASGGDAGSSTQGGKATEGGRGGNPSGGTSTSGGSTGLDAGAGGDVTQGGSGAQGGEAGAAGSTDRGGGAGEGGQGGAGGENLGGDGGVGGMLQPFDPNQGLILHYPFEETMGTTVSDHSPSGKPAVVMGTPTWVTTGKVGRALQLSGQQTYVALPSDFMTPLEEVTVSIWFNQDARVLWTRVLDFGSSTLHWMYFAPATVQANEQGARAALDVANFITAELHMTSVLSPPAEWIHVALTWKKTSFACYINGVLASEDTTPMYTPAEFVTLTPGGETWRAWIGRSSFPDPYLVGRVDEFRAYDRALSAEHVAALYALTQ